MRASRALGAVAVLAALGACSGGGTEDGSAGAAGQGRPPGCGPGILELAGEAGPDDAGTYELVAFDVPPGTARLEVGYEWAPAGAGVVDLGLWDADGTAGPEAFRFWSGSRQGRLDQDMDPVVVAPDGVERTVVPDEIEPGTWHVELGLAAVEAPLRWRVEVRCPAGEQAEVPEPDPVDPDAVVRDEPGWYAADLHLHGYHSSPDGPDADEMVELAIEAGLDVVPVTEYVTPAHWDRLGEAQRNHPGVLLWPGREVITYDGHLVVLGETPGSVEYRRGLDGTTLGDIQRAAVRDGALVSLAHPTLFPPDTFGSACRGCFLGAIDEVDWSATHLVEVVTEGSVALIEGNEVPNPFVGTAVELWEEQLRNGRRLTAVAGSDDKEGDRYGSTMTMIRAEELSRRALDRALRDGHAYVRGLGRESPTVEVAATAARSDPAPGDPGTAATMGDTLRTDRATLEVTVRGGDGQFLTLRRDGTEVERVALAGDEARHAFTLERDPGSGPLGTFFGLEVRDTTTFPGTELRTVITNPVFLAGG